MIDTSILEFSVYTLKLLHKNGFTNAIIAGGAIRDSFFDILPRDIDIFIWDPDHSTENTPRISRKGTELREIMELQPRNYSVAGDKVSRCRGEDKSGGPKISNVWDVMKRCTPFQVISTRVRPEEYVNKFFNIGLCKAYCDGSKLRFTSDFFNDATNKTFTIVGQDMDQWNYDRTIYHHIPKLSHKFPGFTVKVASHNKHLID